MRLAALCGALLTLAAVGPAAAEPRWWVGGGGYAAVETGDLDATLGTEGGGFLGGGVHLVRLGPVLLGLEAEGSVGRVSADLSPDRDDVTVWRARLGARATWWRPGDAPRLVPYLRAGGVYRADRGDLIDDDGLGWYAGAGLDVRLGEHWSLGPFLIYEAVSLSVSTRTFLLGLGVTYSR